MLRINLHNEALLCRDIKCNIHTEDIQKLFKDVINICSHASTRCLPHTSLNNYKKVIPGWNEHVKEHAQNAKEWHDVWVQQGKPRDGDVANMKRNKIKISLCNKVCYQRKYKNSELQNG